MEDGVSGVDHRTDLDKSVHALVHALTVVVYRTLTNQDINGIRRNQHIQ